MPGNDGKPARKTRAKAKPAAEMGEKTGKKRAVKKKQVRRKAAPRQRKEPDTRAHTDGPNPVKAAQPGAERLTELAKDLTKGADRTWFIVDMMSRGLWLRRVSRRFLAQLWGLSESRVQDLSSAAWNIIQRPEEREKIEEIREVYRLQCETWAADAFEHGEREEARKLQEQAGKYLGLFENKTRIDLGKGLTKFLETAEKVLPPEMAKLLFEALAASADESEQH